MANETKAPEFAAFARWVSRQGTPVDAPTSLGDKLSRSAQSARDEFLQLLRHEGPSASRSKSQTEVLQLLAAASTENNERPPELMTARGFRVVLAFDEGSNSVPSSIGVLVQCPKHLVGQLQGQTAYLLSEAGRFELGQFDSDGKAIGELPAGIEITLADIARGKVKLEEPGTSEDP